MRFFLLGLALFTLFIVLILPISMIVLEAFAQGWPTYLGALLQTHTLSALRLTAIVVFWSILFNTIFGLACAWFITRYGFRFKTVLLSIVDLPLSISPVISGLIFIMAFGIHSPIGSWLYEHGIRVIFSPLGIVLATTFVSLPFVARELISFMQAQGSEEEEAAYMLGASGFQILTRITLPNIKTALFYGVILATARAIGEFGAVSVVSGHIEGLTSTLSLHIEVLYNDYQFNAAFAVATLMMGFGLISLVLRYGVERRRKKWTSLSDR